MDRKADSQVGLGGLGEWIRFLILNDPVEAVSDARLADDLERGARHPVQDVHVARAVFDARRERRHELCSFNRSSVLRTWEARR